MTGNKILGSAGRKFPPIGSEDGGRTIRDFRCFYRRLILGNLSDNCCGVELLPQLHTHPEKQRENMRRKSQENVEKTVCCDNGFLYFNLHGLLDVDPCVPFSCFHQPVLMCS